MFLFNKCYVAGWYPRNIMLDFEQSALNAIAQIFPNSVLTGCHFHLGQCISRKMKDRDDGWPELYAIYRNNEDMKKRIKCLHSLAFVPEQHVYRYFCILIYHLPNNNDIRCDIFEVLRVF